MASRSERARRTAVRGASWLCGLGLVLLVGWAAHTLARSPCLGVADILDYWRVMQPAGIAHLAPPPHPGYYVTCTFRTGEADLLAAPSSSALLAWLARKVSWGVSPGPGLMDLRQMGLLCLTLVALILLAGLAAKLSPALALCLCYVLFDPGYLLFFNSFYADGALFIALFGTTIWLERRGDPAAAEERSPIARAGEVALLLVLALLGGASKMQYVLFPLVVAAALAVGALARRTAFRRVLPVIGALTLLAAVSFWNFFYGPGPRFLQFNNYHAVYGGILRVTADPERVLQRLDVPAELRDLPRTDVWSAGIADDHPIHRHLRDLSRLELLTLYATDVHALRGVAAAIENDLARLASHPRGNYVQGKQHHGPRKKTFQTPWQHSRLSRRLLGPWPWLTWALLLAATTWVLAGLWRRRWNGAKAALSFLLLWSVSQFAVTVLGEGLINLHHHLVAARLALDLALILLFADVVESMARPLTRPAVRRSAQLNPTADGLRPETG